MFRALQMETFMPAWTDPELSVVGVQVYIWAEEGVCEVRSEKCIWRNKQ